MVALLQCHFPQSFPNGLVFQNPGSFQGHLEWNEARRGKQLGRTTKGPQTQHVLNSKAGQCVEPLRSTHTHTQHYAGAQYNKLHTQCTQDYFQRSHTYICKAVEVSVPTHIKVTTLNAQGKPCPLIFDKVEGNLQRGTV